MKYIWNNNEYTQEDIDAALEATGKDLDTYLSENKIEALEVEEEEEKTNKQNRIEKREEKKLAKTGDVAESADVASDFSAYNENTELEQEDTFLELPEELKPAEIVQTDIEIEKPEDTGVGEVEDTVINETKIDDIQEEPGSLLDRLKQRKLNKQLEKDLEKQKLLNINEDIDFGDDIDPSDIRKGNFKLNKILKQKGLYDITAVSEISPEQLEKYENINTSAINLEPDLENAEVIGYATKKFNIKVPKLDYSTPDINSFFDPARQESFDKAEKERNQQQKYVLFQEQNEEYKEKINTLLDETVNLNEESVDYKEKIFQINNLNTQINNNNSELTRQFAAPTLTFVEKNEDGTATTTEKITPIYRTKEGRVFISSKAGFYKDKALAEVEYDTIEKGKISISEDAEALLMAETK